MNYKDKKPQIYPSGNTDQNSFACVSPLRIKIIYIDFPVKEERLY